MSDDASLHGALQKSAEFKDEGNAFFNAKDWTSARIAYNQGLACLPSPPVVVVDSAQRQGTGDHETAADHQGGANEDDAQGEQAAKADAGKGKEVEQDLPTEKPEQAVKTPMQEACCHARVILHSNIAACDLKLEAWDAAVKAATAALDEDPHHHKALWRRAKANEAIDSWSSLTSAQKDYTTLTEIVPASQPLYRDASTVLRSLEPRIEAARKRDTDKMLGQLKEVGNSVLGWFGMSTDNFKMVPNEQGGYSMNFVNNPSQ